MKVNHTMELQNLDIVLDEKPHFRNDGSTLISPNGIPTYDIIRIRKAGVTFPMRPWNAGVLYS